MNKKLYILCVIILISTLASCENLTDRTLMHETTDITPTITKTYTEITQEKAKEMMSIHENYIILDVRSEKEYDMGHIPGAISIPDYEIAKRALLELPDKNAVILVYSGGDTESKTAASVLADMGYTNVYEFGGIDTWEYAITR